ncbi:MAG: thioredoxin family protein [Bacteroidales bacterium]|nr:thioredoxin family protein [Bacteroidales bacterium]
MFRILLLVLALQASPQIHWKSEVKEGPEGNQLILTGDLDPGIDHVTGTVTYMPCEGEACYMPVDWDFEAFFKARNSGSGRVIPGLPAQQDVVGDSSTSDKQTLWSLILEAILWGFAMLLTPCVFPMVPMTVSFFMKGSENPRQGRLKAALYGLFIVLLYTVPISLIIGITWIVGGSGVTADIFNWLSTHWLPNILFFLVFMVFAASFFGAFEITLPSKWTNSADKNSDKKGIGGIFFLALTLVLVSFSCTGPIVGTVLIKSTQGEFWTPMVTMLAFSIAFALPFTLLALFPSLIKKLPKSGGWLNSVKVVLGFIEIALGLKFLSTADQTYHWHLLDREVYLAIWIAVFTLLGLYLIGKIRFKNDSPLEYLSVPRLTLAIAVFSFVVYLLPGMWGAPLKALSGYLPPMETQDFVLRSVSTQASGETAVLPASDAAPAAAPGTIRIAHDLPAYGNLKDGLAAAKAAGKPVFLDFTGYGCVNCREMEARVWSDPEVLRRLREDFVIVALHVDDKTKLPESEWVTNDRGKVLKDVGRVNSYIALSQFGVNAQPNYFLLDGDGNRLAGPRPYNLDVQGFIDFLDSAL